MQVPRVHVSKSHLVVPDGQGRWKRTAHDPPAVLAEIRRLHRENDAVYVVDVRGAEVGEPDFPFFQRLERKGVFPWLEGGLRRRGDVMDAFFAGADRITIQLHDMPPETFKQLVEMAEHEIYLGLRLDPQGQIDQWKNSDLVDYVRRTEATGVVLAGDAQTPPQRAESVCLEFRRQGISTVFAPAPGSGQRVRDDAVDVHLSDAAVGP